MYVLQEFRWGFGFCHLLCMFLCENIYISIRQVDVFCCCVVRALIKVSAKPHHQGQPSPRVGGTHHHSHQKVLTGRRVAPEESGEWNVDLPR